MPYHDHFKLYKLDSLKIIKIKSFVDLYFQHVLSKGITCILDVRKTPKLFKTFYPCKKGYGMNNEYTDTKRIFFNEKFTTILVYVRKNYQKVTFSQLAENVLIV